MSIFDLKTMVIVVLAVTLYLQMEHPEKLEGFLPKFIVGGLVGFTVLSELIIAVNKLI
ncbi:TPA: hypothetical protein U2C91_001609 [Streptococcus suis]|nr:hypothetical protein [Streptococcus suis]HEP1820058.1 hypothetical protein [Streptococcus suis]